MKKLGEKLGEKIGAMVLMGMLSGCGVKGDPQAPQMPAQIGRGQPTYRKATEEFAAPDLPGAPADEGTSEKKKNLDQLYIYQWAAQDFLQEKVVALKYWFLQEKKFITEDIADIQIKAEIW